LYYDTLPESTRELQNTYKYLIPNHLDELSILTDPTPFHQIKPFERAAQVNINVFTHEESKVYCIRVSKTNYERSIDLLIVQDVSNPDLSHWCAIINLSRLLRLRRCGTSHICRFCLNPFSSARVLEKHKSLCLVNGVQGNLEHSTL